MLALRSLTDVLDAPHSSRTQEEKNASTERQALKRGKNKATNTHTHTRAQEEGSATLKAVKEALTLERFARGRMRRRVCLHRALIEP